MEDSIAFMLLLQAVLIGLNAIFACAEIAVLSVNDNKLARLAAQGDRRAVRLQRLTSQPARFLATIQVAITLSGFLGSAFAADNFSDKLVDALVALGVTIPAKTLDTIAVVLITIILSYFTLIFGELVPKRLAMRKAEALALGMSPLVSAIAKLFAPIVWLLTASTNGGRRRRRFERPCILGVAGSKPGKRDARCRKARVLRAGEREGGRALSQHEARATRDGGRTGRARRHGGHRDDERPARAVGGEI